MLDDFNSGSLSFSESVPLLRVISQYSMGVQTNGTRTYRSGAVVVAAAVLMSSFAIVDYSGVMGEGKPSRRARDDLETQSVDRDDGGWS